MIFDKVKLSRAETETIIAIMLRAASLMNFERYGASRIEVAMDLEVCHALACPLKLDEMLTADTQDFVHDVSGIMRHLNRQTGQLDGCFMPRFAQSQGA